MNAGESMMASSAIQNLENERARLFDRIMQVEEALDILRKDPRAAKFMNLDGLIEWPHNKV